MATALPARAADRLVQRPHRVDSRSDALEPAGRWEALALRLPVQHLQIDDRRIVAGRIERGSLGRRERDRHSSPAGKIARSSPGSKAAGTHDRRAPTRRPIGQHHALDRETCSYERPHVIAHVEKKSSAPRDTPSNSARGFSWLR